MMMIVCLTFFEAGSFYRLPAFSVKELRELGFIYLSESFNNQSKEINFAAFVDNQIVGIVGLQKNPYDKTNYWFMFVTILEQFKGKGIGSQLVRAAIEYAIADNCTINISSYSSEGLQRVRPVVVELDKKYPNKIFEQDYRFI